MGMVAGCGLKADALERHRDLHSQFTKKPEVRSETKWGGRVVSPPWICLPRHAGSPTLPRQALLKTPPNPPMAFDVPGSQAIPDGVPLGWEAPWEKPHKMKVE